MIEKILSGSKFSLVFEKQMFRINKLYDKTRHSRPNSWTDRADFFVDTQGWSESIIG